MTLHGGSTWKGLKLPALFYVIAQLFGVPFAEPDEIAEADCILKLTENSG